jgi:hypothetical protein
MGTPHFAPSAKFQFRMSSIIRVGETFHGISADGRGGVFNELGRTYAGQIRDGYACGLGVLTWSFGLSKVYAEYGPDGKYAGRYLDRYSSGTTGYSLYERNNRKDCTVLSADGRSCWYNDVACAPDDPRVLELIAQVAPVEVRPAAPASPPSVPPPPQLTPN